MAWNDIFVWKKTPDRKPSDVPAQQNVMHASTQKPLVSYENTITAEAALGHPFVYFCMVTVAKALAVVNWYAEADSSLPVSQQAGANDVKAMNDLLGAPSPNFSPYELKFWMALNYAGYGRIPFKVGVGTFNNANGIYPLDAKFTKENTDDRGNVVAYTYGFGENSETLPIRAKKRVGQAYAAQISTPTLGGEVDFTTNVTPLRAIGLPSSIMRLLLQRAHDTADGHPNTKYVISADKAITEPQKKNLREHLESSGPGQENSGNILFISGQQIKIDELNNDLSDIHSKMPTDDMARMIARAFGIPNALVGLGAADGAKFANNFDGSRASFYEDTIIPGYCEPIATGLTQALCPPGMLIKFDLDSIPAVNAARAVRAKDVDQIGVLTVDERRELLGYPKVGGEQGSKLGPLPKIETAPVAKPEPGDGA
jgi:phage portal protein BeeE